MSEAEIDLSKLSKSELKALMQRSQRKLKRLARTGNESPSQVLSARDERVKAIADQVRTLSDSLGMPRRDVLAAIAGSMKIKLASKPVVAVD